MIHVSYVISFTVILQFTIPVMYRSLFLFMEMEVIKQYVTKPIAAACYLSLKYYFIYYSISNRKQCILLCIRDVRRKRIKM